MTLEASLWASRQPHAPGLMGLCVQHDNWCVALKPPGTHCNCSPTFAMKKVDEDMVSRIMREERERTGR